MPRVNEHPQKRPVSYLCIMAVLPIVAYGDPILKKRAEEIEKDHPQLDKLIEDMFETMYEANGVGLAAPQVGKSIRLFVVDASPFAEPEEDGTLDERGKGLEDFKKVFINPVVHNEEGAKWGFKEGCLSIPKIREDVMRNERVHITWLNENFEEQEAVFEGYAARVVQHEYDHLEGVLFTEKISPFRRRMIKGKLSDITKRTVDVEYAMRFRI